MMCCWSKTVTNRDRHATPDTVASVHTCKPHRLQTIAKKFSPYLFLRQWYGTSIVHVLLAELGSLGHRISWALEIRSWALRGYTAPLPTVLAWRPDRTCRTCRRAYILDMQSIQSLHPSLTIVDSHLITQVWWAAAQSAHRMDTQQNQQKSCSLCSPMGGNSMLPQAVQQSTKRGQ